MDKMNGNGNVTIENLFKEYYSLLTLVAFKILGDEQASKDVVQDFFISIIQKETNLTFTHSFKAYAVKAIKNLSCTYLEKSKREQEFLNSMEPTLIDFQTQLEPDPNTQKIHRLIAQLPENRRHIFMAYVLDGLSYSEIAEMNGISINTVKTQMKRAYAYLRDHGSNEMLISLLLIATLR